MSPLDLSALAPKTVSEEEKKILDAWKELLTRVEGVAMTFPDDKDELEDEMRYWVNQWTRIMSEVEKMQEIANASRVALRFGGEYASIVEASVRASEWTTRFKTIDEQREADARAETLARAASIRKPAPESVEEDPEMRDTMCEEVDIEDVSALPTIFVKGKQRENPVVEVPKKASKAVENTDPCERCAKQKRRCIGTPGHSCDECRRQKLGCTLSHGAKIKQAEQQVAKAQASVDGLRGVGGATSFHLTISDDEESVIITAPPKRKSTKRKRMESPEDPEAERRGMLRMEARLLQQSNDLYDLSVSLRDMRVKRFAK